MCLLEFDVKSSDLFDFDVHIIPIAENRAFWCQLFSVVLGEWNVRMTCTLANIHISTCVLWWITRALALEAKCDELRSDLARANADREQLKQV